MFFTKNPPGFYIETIHKEYTAKDPVFFDTAPFAWCQELEAKAPQIIECLRPVLADDFAGLTTNPEDRFQFPPKIWKGFPFYFNGFKFQKHLDAYPFLAAELAKIPDMVSASVSVLEPGAHLLPHNGNSNGVMRYHLGLNIPAPMPECGFIIGGQGVSWEVGKSFMFCNMNVHSAHNKTSKRRHILMIDVVRPEFVSIKKRICALTLAQILTNNTADKVRGILGVNKSDQVKQDPTKEMKYEANKSYAMKDEKISFTIAAFRIAEKMVLGTYIVAISTLFFFKKLQ